jgi:hypothetical protein
MLAFPPHRSRTSHARGVFGQAGHHADRDLGIAIGREFVQSSHPERLFFI